MKQTKIAVLLSIVAVVGGAILNVGGLILNDLAGIATARSLFVTFLCIALWVCVLFLAAKNKSRKVLMYCFVFWIIATLFAGAVAWMLLYGPHHPWVAAFSLLALGQLLGVAHLMTYLQIHHVVWFTLFLMLALFAISLVMSVVSLVLYCITVLRHRRSRGDIRK